MDLSDQELINKAKSIIKPNKMKHGFIASDCGCALISESGNLYLGVSIDTCSGMGFCAEHSAIASMITNGEYKIKKIVAVDEDGLVLPPCGRCREFIHQIHEDNINTMVIVRNDKIVTLKELLPFRWDENI